MQEILNDFIGKDIFAPHTCPLDWKISSTILESLIKVCDKKNESGRGKFMTTKEEGLAESIVF